MVRPKKIGPDISSVTPISHLDCALSPKLANALSEAQEFIGFYDWVSHTTSAFLGAGFDGIVYIFLFGIVSTREDVDPWVWVIVGDVPPAYITCEDAKNPYEALDAYVGAMEEWVQAARSGSAITDLIPVNLPATPDNADILAQRLEFIDERILNSLK